MHVNHKYQLLLISTYKQFLSSFQLNIDLNLNFIAMCINFVARIALPKWYRVDFIKHYNYMYLSLMPEYEVFLSFLTSHILFD